MLWTGFLLPGRQGLPALRLRGIFFFHVQPHFVHAHEGRAVFSLNGFSPHGYGL